MIEILLKCDSPAEADVRSPKYEVRSPARINTQAAQGTGVCRKILMEKCCDSKYV
jgi:hypothetical protein